ncbi:hypothetical protein EVAR_42515_1 [Eumeta japonica]|uniref:Uncharacterized protein n=1 Tax=Eumeta variegata TaxID=151549 RepID=A0A4C1XIV3_EUMVA|nr:hypothetical protein EVAR_42515_1 [Eumeta japonica]
MAGERYTCALHHSQAIQSGTVSCVVLYLDVAPLPWRWEILEVNRRCRHRFKPNGQRFVSRPRSKFRNKAPPVNGRVLEQAFGCLRDSKLASRGVSPSLPSPRHCQLHESIAQHLYAPSIEYYRESEIRGTSASTLLFNALFLAGAPLVYSVLCARVLRNGVLLHRVLPYDAVSYEDKSYTIYLYSWKLVIIVSILTSVHQRNNSDNSGQSLAMSLLSQRLSIRRHRPEWSVFAVTHLSGKTFNTETTKPKTHFINTRPKCSFDATTFLCVIFASSGLVIWS